MQVSKKFDTAKIFHTIVGAFVGGLLVYGLIHFHGGAGTEEVKPVVTKQGDHVLFFIDNTAPTLPQSDVLDSPYCDALKLKGMCSIIDINEMDDGEKYVEKMGYAALISEAGGAPAMAVLTKDGEKCYAGRIPSEIRANDSVLKKYVRNLPPPLPAVEWPKVVKRSGKESQTLTDGQNVFIEEDGVKRLLGARPPTAQMRSALPSYGAHNPVFPQASWRDVNHLNLFGNSDFVLNQGDISSCVGNAWAGALRRARVLAGMEDIKLSPGYVYSLINHNQDQGAVISDGINALLKVGTVPYSLVGEKPFYQRQMPASAKDEAKRFRLLDAYRCDTWAEVMSALQTGRFQVVCGVMVGRTWTTFDSNGVCGHDRGPGNHAIMLEGSRKLPNGKWVGVAVNSWSSSFGPFADGRMLLDEEHLFGNGCMTDACAIRAASRDSKDSFAPPPYGKAKLPPQFNYADQEGN